jgi:antitoxin component of RelBE/YafQ-DinJ toxin-antitoxin module
LEEIDMGKPVSSNAQRVETTALNTKVNKVVFDKFKDCCKEQGYPLNVLLETFMQQYANGRFKIDTEDVLKFKNDDSEMDTLNTTFNKEIYLRFKAVCKSNGLFVKHVVTAFMEQYATRNFILEYTNVADVVTNRE